MGPLGPGLDGVVFQHVNSIPGGAPTPGAGTVVAPPSPRETRDPNTVLSPRDRRTAVTSVGAGTRVRSSRAPGHGPHRHAQLSDGPDTGRLQRHVYAGGARGRDHPPHLHMADSKDRFPAASRELFLVRAVGGRVGQCVFGSTRLSAGRKSSTVSGPDRRVAQLAETGTHGFQCVRPLAGKCRPAGPVARGKRGLPT